MNTRGDKGIERHNFDPRKREIARGGQFRHHCHSGHVLKRIECLKRLLGFAAFQALLHMIGFIIRLVGLPQLPGNG